MNTDPKNINPDRAPSHPEQLNTDSQPQVPEESLPDSGLFDTVIYSYSRKQALADGVQIEASQMADEAGFKHRVFLTESVYREYVRVPEGVTGQDEEGRLWDILTVLYQAIRNAQPGIHRLTFRLYVRNSDENPAELVILAAECGAMDFDDPVPAITVMLPDED